MNKSQRTKCFFPIYPTLTIYFIHTYVRKMTQPMMRKIGEKLRKKQKCASETMENKFNDMAQEHQTNTR